MNATSRYDELIMSYLDGLCPSDDALVLLSWLSECEENRIHFESIKRVWELTSFVMPDAIDVEAALCVVNNRIAAVETREQQNHETNVVKAPWIKRNLRALSGVAAAVVVVLVMSVFFFNSLGREVIMASKDDNCVLPDGTSVYFDAPSKLSYKRSFGESKRKVVFEGTARFDVAKDAEKPFIIRCDNAQVEVLGTSFLLDASGDSQVVDLYSGKVRMSSVDRRGKLIDAVEILPGERAVFLKEKGELERVSALDVKKEDLAKNHELVFNDECLKFIVQSVEYIYNVNISLDEVHAERKIMVRFADDPINEVLETIASVADLELTKSGSTFILH